MSNCGGEEIDRRGRKGRKGRKRDVNVGDVVDGGDQCGVGWRMRDMQDERGR